MANVKQRFSRLGGRVAAGALSLAVLIAPLVGVGTAHAYFTSRFAGAVTDQNGNGIAGVQIHFLPLGDFTGPSSTDVTTAADGTYETYTAAGELYEDGTGTNTYYSYFNITFTPPASVGGSPIVLSNYQVYFDPTGAAHIINQQFTAQTIATPQGLTAASPTQQPALSWSAVNGADSYKVYRDGTVVAQPTATSYTDTAASEGSHVYTVAAVSTGGTQSAESGSVNVVVDKTVPVTGTPNWSANPAALGSSSTLTVPASDALSGVAGGEYFLGTDPGVGNATAMAYGSGTLSASLGSSLDVGVYDIGVRARDAAGNWSAATTTMLVIYDPSTTLRATGKDKKDFIPSLAAGDHLPGLTSATQTDVADYGFTVQYKNGVLDPKNDFHFAYSNCGKNQNGTGCHSINLDATSFAWIIIDQGSSRARFQGVAAVTVDGVTTGNPFTVQAIDGDRLSPTGNDTLLLKVYAPGADPAVASPLYQASGSMAKGNAVRVQ